MKIELPTIKDLETIDKIALQVHECHVKKNESRYRKKLDIDSIGVDETYKNRDIGKKLLEYVKEYAKENDYTDLRLTVNEENNNAKHLYEQIGFKIKNIVYSMQVYLEDEENE